MLVAVSVTITGVQAVLAARKAPATPATQADLDGLRAMVTGAQVLDHDHLDANLPNPASLYPGAKPAAGEAVKDGYQMPADMMPGMPADDESRLLVKLSMANQSGEARLIDPSGEFALRNEQGQRFAAEGDTFGVRSRLNPRYGVATGVYFDIPTAGLGQHEWVLEWSRDGHSKRLAMTFDGQSQPHSH